MKAKIAVLALSLTALGLSSQAQTSFGLRAGVNFNNINGDDEAGDKLENDLKVGFHIGATADIPLAPQFYIQPGILFSQKGASSKVEDDDSKIALSYIEVPVNFLFKPTLGAGKLLLGVGPYVGFAVGGSFKPDEGEDVDLEFKSDLSMSEAMSGTPYMKRLDFGGNLLAGYEFTNKFSVQLNAQLGMANLIPKIEGEQPDNIKWKNTGFGLSLGYRF